MKYKNEYINAIDKLIDKLGKDGNVIITLPTGVVSDLGMGGYDTVLREEGKGVELYSSTNQKRTPATEVGGEVLYHIYCYLFGAREDVELRETLIEHKEPEEREWVLEPEPIVSNGETIGLLGVALVETTDTENLMAPVFLSPDGTYATLTMYGDGHSQEKEQALKDLTYIQGGIQNLIEKMLKL